MIATQQLQQAQQAAAAAQAAATQAQQQAAQQSSVLTENTQAVSSLQGAVTDLKTNNVSLATTVQEQQAKVEKQITNPDAIHYKGVTISPAGATWRLKRCGALTPPGATFPPPSAPCRTSMQTLTPSASSLAPHVSRASL